MNMPPTAKIYFKIHCTSFDLVKFYKIYGTDDRKQSEELFKNIIRACANTKGKENFKKVANDILNNSFMMLNSRLVNAYWRKVQSEVNKNKFKEALVEENIAASILKKQTASRLIQQLHRSNTCSVIEQNVIRDL